MYTDPHKRLLQLLNTMLIEINTLQAQVSPVAYANTTIDMHTAIMDIAGPGDTSTIHAGIQTLEQLTREALTITRTLLEDQPPAELEEPTLAEVFSRLVEETAERLGIPSRIPSPVTPDVGQAGQSRQPESLPPLAVPPPSETIRILIVDGQAVSRAGLHHLLEAYAGLHIVGEATDGVQAVSETLELGPQVVLMDTHLPEGQSLEALRQIKQLNLDTKVLLLAAQDREEYLYETLRAGADGYILKDIALDELVQAIHRVARGEVFIQPQIASRLISRYGQEGKSGGHLDPLTNREREVLQLLARGLRNKEIAARLYVSERTINFHLTNIYQKLQVSGRTEALSKALEQGLISSP
jgi:DNA-binding NarL/FixJ family response regulator